jgi:hypothetical protein
MTNAGKNSKPLPAARSASLRSHKPSTNNNNAKSISQAHGQAGECAATA